MAYTYTERKRIRKNFGNRDSVLEIPYLLQMQKDAYTAFLQADVAPKKRTVEGLQAIDQLGDAIIELERTIPREVDWALQVDGHTDARKISSREFPSNWELSSARALSVVKYLISRGVSPRRLVAAGYGEFAPLEEGSSDEVLRRNRRIELKLTNR